MEAFSQLRPFFSKDSSLCQDDKNKMKNKQTNKQNKRKNLTRTVSVIYHYLRPIDVRKHHDQGDSYKRKHLTGVFLVVQRFDPLLMLGSMGDTLAGMELEKQLRAIDLLAKRDSGFGMGF